MWKISIDTGGTFTDCIAVSPQGEVSRVKVLSSSTLRGQVVSQQGLHVGVSLPSLPQSSALSGFTFQVPSTGQVGKVAAFDPRSGQLTLEKPLAQPLNPGDDFMLTTGEEAPVLAIRLATGTPPGQSFPPIQLRLGTTKATNALLEGKTASVALLITRGFEDLPAIGNQQRSSIFSLAIEKPEPLAAHIVGVAGRLQADGQVLEPLTPEQIAVLVAQLQEVKPEAVAISLLHGYQNPAQEMALKTALQQAGYQYVSHGAALHPGIGFLTRTETTIVNAALAPIMEGYLTGIRQQLQGARVLVMSSAGGLLPIADFQPKDSLLSGPAGGVVGAVFAAKQAGMDRVISFDMGGTSTDVARYDGAYDYSYLTKVGHAQVYSPGLAVHTVAAGGGSVCAYQDFLFTVGPESAGAFPGPACYGAGGPLTVTDVNLLLGRLDPAYFGVPINREAAEKALEAVWEKSGKQASREAVLTGFLALANENMADAIRKISIQKGFDLQDYSLVAFGGAGGQHACEVAGLLGIGDILVPYDAGLLSALGMSTAWVSRYAAQQMMLPLQEALPQLEPIFGRMTDALAHQLASDGFPGPYTLLQQALSIRLKGQEHTLEIPYQPAGSLLPRFRQQYKKIYGHWLEGRELEVTGVHLRVGTAAQSPTQPVQVTGSGQPVPLRHQAGYVRGSWVEIPVYDWEMCLPGEQLEGPCLLVGRHATVWVAAGWEGHLEEGKAFRMQQQRQVAADPAHAKASESMGLALFTNRFSAIAEEMGAILQRVSFSVNVKERLDFSCALLNEQGQLLVNAPHVPVHLGSLGVCVRKVCEVLDLQPGDVAITNHPGFGGSHLPDVTLVAPVHDRNGELLGYVCNRAHHAEIGGKTPGSMPADATCLAEEGVVFKPGYLVRKGVLNWEAITATLQQGPFPTRAVQENLADLQAGLASLEAGKQGLAALAERYGTAEVKARMRMLQQDTAGLLRKKIAVEMAGKTLEASELLDDGTPLCVRVREYNGKLRIDFTGTGPVHPGNLNANPAIVQSVVLYVLRLWTGRPIPLNEGLMEPVELVLPEGTLLNPVFPDNPAACPAVVGGNTETSQRLTDTLLKAFGLAACSYGSMNNVVFGNDAFGFYETIGGGTGAIPGTPGADAVHQHMTNTRITDAEIMEFRYPVRVERFAIRHGSGGKGRWPGGCGIERKIRFLVPVSLTLLTQHRRQAPYGMEGGGEGQPGSQWLWHIDGSREQLPGSCSQAVAAGEALEIHTPGGGAWGMA